ncbi:MAG: hypothetical protein H6565_15840 [Lewinellaceae bacterium]|nr:hypothetical protein [Lewinellaceae bacterium]
MEINEIIATTRSLLQQGDTGKALRAILDHLEKDARFAETTRVLQLAEANYNAARQQELKGILSFQEAQRQYSQINDALLSTLDTIAAGPPAQRTLGAPPDKSVLYKWLIGAAVVLALGLLLGLWFSSRQSDAGTGTKQEASCPAFAGAGQRVIILPFQDLANSPASPELTIQSRIRELSGKNEFPTQVEILGNYDVKKNNPDIRTATSIGQRCMADLVIWGLYEKSPDSIKVDIQYVFTKSGELGRSDGFLAFKDLPSLRDGRMVRGLDDAIFALCGLMAIQEKKGALAQQWFKKVHNPQETDRMLMKKLEETQE